MWACPLCSQNRWKQTTAFSQSLPAEVPSADVILRGKGYYRVLLTSDGSKLAFATALYRPLTDAALTSVSSRAACPGASD